MALSPAPVALFAFNRPAHVTRALRALAANPEAATTALHVFVDGPRWEAERALVAEVLEVVSQQDGFAKVSVHAVEANRGLFQSITNGVRQVTDRYGSVIVVEDDVEVAPSFLGYMNAALARYRDNFRVGSIHAYAPPIAGLPEYYFLRGADCWGWATWADRWTTFQYDPHALLRTLAERKLLGEFTASHGYQSLLQLVRRVQGRNQSWAIQWHASLFLADMHTLHPGKSLVVNTGNDGSGTHASRTNAHGTSAAGNFSGYLPEEVEHDVAAARALSRFLDREALGQIPVPQALLKAHAISAARREVARIGADT